jgi:DNA helicase-2/ATP-dependent DNA helicase PcrA
MEEGVFPHSRALFDDTEMEEERRLAYVGITRAEERLYVTGARMRTLFGRTNYNPASRFLQEIPDELLEGSERSGSQAGGFGRSGAGFGAGNVGYGSRGTSFAGRSGESRFAAKSPAGAGGAVARSFTQQPVKLPHHGAASGVDWKLGDKVKHAKWGTGTIVKMKGTGDDLELDIAFPSPTGIKKLLAKFAPVEKA